MKPSIEKELVKVINQHTLNDIWEYALVIYGSFSLVQLQNLSDPPEKTKYILLHWLVTVTFSHSLIWMIRIIQ